MDIEIRKANKNDIDSIVNLANELYETEMPFDTNLKAGYYKTKTGRKQLLKDIKSKKKIVLVAILNNNIVGFVDGYIYDKEEMYKKKVAYLDSISVSKDYKRNGIGTKLIDEFTNIMKEKGCSYIKLNAFRNNVPAVELYKKKDFKEYSVFYMKKID